MLPYLLGACAITVVFFLRDLVESPLYSAVKSEVKDWRTSKLR